MTVILGLDDTLVDTSGFKRVLFHSLESCVVPAEVVAYAYAVLREHEQFSFDGLYRFLPFPHRPDTHAYQSAMRRVIAHYPGRVYRDVVWFLRRCRGCRRILFTRGDREVQEIKIRSLRLRPLFSCVVITNDRKKFADLASLLRVEEPTVLIDNDGHFVSTVVEHFPKIHGYCLARRDPSIGSFADLRAVYRAMASLRH